MQRLSSAAKAACSCEASTGLPAEITVAQWALESGWGADAPGNNCFGIKAYPGCAATQSLPTIEYIGGVRREVTSTFVVFDSLDACFEKHAALITQGRPYAAAWGAYQQNRNVSQLINGLAGVYATDPNYAAKLKQIASMPEIQAMLAVFRKPA